MAKFVQILIDKAAVLSQMHGGYASRQELAGFLGTASVALFTTYLPKRTGGNRPGAPASYQVNTYVDRALTVFLRERQYERNPEGRQGEITATGELTAPGDMVYPTALETGGGTYPVDILDDAQKVYGLNDPIAGPAPQFPKAVVRPGNKYRIYPVPATATLTYLALPPVPVYAETLDANNDLVYDDAASVDVGWGRQHEMTLIQATLRLLAENTGNGQLMQAANALTQESL